MNADRSAWDLSVGEILSCAKAELIVATFADAAKRGGRGLRERMAARRPGVVVRSSLSSPTQLVATPPVASGSRCCTWGSPGTTIPTGGRSAVWYWSGRRVRW